MFSEAQIAFMLETLKDRKKEIVDRVINIEGSLIAKNGSAPEHLKSTLLHLKEKHLICDDCISIIVNQKL